MIKKEVMYLEYHPVFPITHVGAGHDLCSSHDKNVNAPLGSPSLPAIQNRSGVPIRQATSGSSRDLSDDEEIEGETAMTENMDPTDAKRVRR